MNTYSEYFDIDEGYYPEINPSSIKDPANRWQKTFPHKTFVELLKAMERMLARGTNADKRGIWIEGSYGTGKSRVVWTLKNLLECSETELKAYFNEYESLKKQLDLRDKLLSSKEEKIVTVYRYASGEIDSTQRLVRAVYDSVERALDEAKIPYKGTKSLRGKVAAWLEDDAHAEIFNIMIAKPEYRGLGSFSGKTVEEIRLQLNNKNVDVDILLEDILTVSEKEGINAFSISMDDLIEWLADVVDENHLKAIVFIWDEFSSFFKNNINNLDDFQKLAELSNEKPFYLMIVTHMSGSLVMETNQAFNIVKDRFVRKEITMPDGIAFDLIHEAINVKEAAKEQWEAVAGELNSYMPNARRAVAQTVNVSEEILARLLPIHPMAALLLKNISTAFASNQRSMFNFIKNESEDLHAFQWFIEHNSPDNEDILTIDYLWDFFYEKGTDEHGNGVGRSNLDIAIATILDTYTINESSLFNDEKIVLKTVLMMQALSQKIGDSMELFLPSARNLNYAFEGTDFDEGRGISLAKALVNKGILYEKPGKVPTFAAAAVSGDQVAIDAIKKRLREETRTIQLFGEDGINTMLALTPGQRFRYKVLLVTKDNFTSTMNKISNESKDYHIRAVFCLARTETEEQSIKSLIKEAVKNPLYYDIAMIDASTTIMGWSRFEQWVDAAANEEYWRPKDGNLANEMKKKADAYIADWKRDIIDGNFVFYPAEKKEETERAAISRGKMSLLQGEMANNVLKIYPFSFDNAKVSENFFDIRNLSQGAKNGITQVAGGIYQQSAVASLLKDVWQAGDHQYWKAMPNLPISQLKVIVDNYIGERLKSDVRISIVDIFQELMSYGFMPCNLYSFLTGFLLKEYIQDQYRYGVGINGDEGGRMTAEKLGEFIGESIKHINTPIKNYREKYIEIMTQNQKLFIEFSGKVFGTDSSLSVEQTVNRMRYRLIELGYPVWCYKKIDTNNLSAFIDKIAVIANSQQESLSALADAFGGMLSRVESAVDNLKTLFTVENGIRALDEFLQEYEDGVIYDLTEKVGVTNVLADVKKQVSSGDALWLWDEDTGIGEIRKLIVDYRIIAASIALKQECHSWHECMVAWGNTARFLKMPYSIILKRFPELNNFVEGLVEILENGEVTYEKREVFLVELVNKSDRIAEALTDQQTIFAEEYVIYLKGLSTDETARVYSMLPTTSFMEEVAVYINNLSEITTKVRQDQEKFKLHKLWDEMTGNSKSPKEWSRKHRTPILALVPETEMVNAKRLFDALNLANPDEQEVRISLQYLESNPRFIKKINDADSIERAFAESVIGNPYLAMLKDFGKVRDHLEDLVPVDTYDWFANESVRRVVKQMAESEYYQNGCDKVVSRIEEMSSDEAKDYLKKLIKENPAVGLEIIAKGEN